MREREGEPRRISQVRSGEEGAKASLKMRGRRREGGLSSGKFVVSFPRASRAPSRARAERPLWAPSAESFVILSRSSHESVAAGNNN